MILDEKSKLKNLGDSILNLLNDIMLVFITCETYSRTGSLIIAALGGLFMFFLNSMILAVSYPNAVAATPEKLAEELPKHLWKISVVNMIVLTALKFL